MKIEAHDHRIFSPSISSSKYRPVSPSLVSQRALRSYWITRIVPTLGVWIWRNLSWTGPKLASMIIRAWAILRWCTLFGSRVLVIFYERAVIIRVIWQNIDFQMTEKPDFRSDFIVHLRRLSCVSTKHLLLLLVHYLETYFCKTANDAQRQKLGPRRLHWLEVGRSNPEYTWVTLRHSLFL